MTTNHPELLDPALTRPGRCDISVSYGYAQPEQAREMFARFFPGTNGASEEFASAITGRQISMCRIQEHLVRNIGDYKIALDRARDPKTWEVEKV